ncbi:ATP-binding protein [Thermodesulfobacteriota bacterium B35]
MDLFQRITIPPGKRKGTPKKNHLLYLESILESSTNTAIVATDQVLRIKYFNAEAARLLGLPKQQAIGRSLEEIHDRFASRGRELRKVIDRLRSRGRYHFEMWHMGHFLDIQISVLRDSDHSFVGLLLMGRDITSLKQAEEEKKKTLLRLQRAEKMEAIGLLAGGVAHDLNNILSGIINYPELLLARLPADSELRKPLQSILAAGRRAAAVVDDLLTMSRGVAMNKQRVSINDLVSEYLHSLERRKLSSLYPDVRLNFDPDPNLRLCRCSPIHITKVVMNLISNAVEATGTEGEVSIRTANESATGTDAASVLLEVRDTGPGISAADREKIFEPFYSTKTLGRSGSGLGLAVVWNAVHAHGGTITVQSSDQGSSFTVRLPACQEGDNTETATSTEDRISHQGNGSVLVVDDIALQREIAGEMLAYLGYGVTAVSSGEEAVEYLRHHTADVVLLDMVLGGMDGAETFREIIRMHPSQFVILVSGFSESDELDKALAEGAAGFLKKPYSMVDLSQALAQGRAEIRQAKYTREEQCT